MSWIASQVPVRVPDRRNFLLQSGWGADVVSISDSVTGDVKPALLVLMGAVVLLYLIACANTTHLFLARSTARQKEIAIRAAIGADRWQLIRFVLLEAMLLSTIAGIVGALIAYWSTKLIPGIVPESLPRISEISLSGTVCLFVLIVSVCTGLILGIIPALRLSISDLQQALKVKTVSSEKSVHRLRNALVITEVALTVVLATGAGLLGKSFQHLVQVNPGFQTQDRMTFTVSLPRAQYPEDAQKNAFFEELLGRIRVLPGVKAAGANASLPMQGENWTATFEIRNRDQSIGPPPGFEYRPITADYFRAMGIPVLRGRGFNEKDRADSPRVAVIDQKLADRFWPGQDPIGKQIGFSNSTVDWAEVIGVVGHVKNSNLETDGLEQVYLPNSQNVERTLSIVIYATGNPSALVDGIRRQVKALDPNLPLYQIGSMDQVVSRATAQSRFNTLLFALFAFMALALVSVGIYGVISYSVTQRKKEIGIRMALGAQPQSVLGMIVGQSMRVSLVGMMVGILLSMALSRFLSSLLFQMSAIDPAVYFGTVVVALLVALVACSFPARRAAYLDPLLSLREE
jgi:putative ABC transport system permease protein